MQVPNETFKAISHLIVSGKTRRFPRIGWLLAHLGGSAPALAPRIAGLSSCHPLEYGLSEADILDEYRRCWWDIALSADVSSLSALEAWGVSDRIVWGSDFPGQNLCSLSSV